MKTSVSSYSFGGYINSLGIFGLIDKAAELGFEGIEFTDGGWTEGRSEKVAKQVAEYAAEKNLKLVAYCVGADFVNGSGGNIDAEIERLKAEVNFAAQLGVMNMRHDVASRIGGRKYSIGYDDALPTIVKGCTEVTKYAEQLGVGTMTENHGYFSQDANRVEKLINAVAHPNFGSLVDIGNFMCADEDPTVSVGIMAPYAKHVHAKDFHWKSGVEINPGEGWFRTRAGNYIRGAIIGHGDAKVAQSINVLKGAGYDGFVSIEFEGMEDNIRGISVGLNNLRRFIG